MWWCFMSQIMTKELTEKVSGEEWNGKKIFFNISEILQKR